jgi:hypothetical protein
MTRALLVLAIAAGCGGKTKDHPPGAPAPAGASGAAQLVLEGVWADARYTLSFRGGTYLLRERLACARLPCASARVRSGSWTRDGAALHLATTTYDVGVEDGGETLVLVPVAIAADNQATLRLRRQHLPPLPGTAWATAGHTLSFTADAFTRTTPTGPTTGTWTLEDGELTLVYDGAEESFAVLFADNTLVLIGPTETLRLSPTP